MIKETVDYMIYNFRCEEDICPGENSSILLNAVFNSITRFIGLATTVFVIVYAATRAFRLAGG